MKRILSFLTVLVIVIFSVGVGAAPTTYRMEPMKMSIDIPEGWIVITQDGPLPETQLKVMGIDTTDLVENIKKKNIYLNAITPSPLSEIVITMNADKNSETVFDFNRYNDDELLKIANDMIADGGKSVTYTNPQISTHPQGKFATFTIEKKQENKTVYGIQNYTVINGQAISIALLSYDIPVADRMAEQLKTVLASVKFDEVKPVPSGITLWMVLGIIAAILIAVTVFFFFIVRKKDPTKNKKGRTVTRI